MDLNLAKFFSDASDAAYINHVEPVYALGFEEVQSFECERFTGYVASTEDAVVLCFRGTQLKFDDLPNLWSTFQQFLTNFNYVQDKRGNYRIHHGFHRELNSIYDALPEVLIEHGAQTKPFFVTGHSTGGALATLAARRLAEDGISVDAAYVFSSPRVGDGEFAESYPIPLYRFEYMSDIIPHIPFSPSVMRIFDGINEQFAPIIELFFPQVHEFRNTEYIHAGIQFFIDWDHELFHSVSEEELLVKGLLEAIFGEMPPSFPGQSAPQRLMGITRFITTFGEVMEQLANGRIRFVQDHLITSFIDYWRRLTR